MFHSYRTRLALASMLVASLLLAIPFVSPASVQAHIGGKAYVKVDGVPVSTNAFSAYYVTIPYDISLGTYTTRQNIEFEVDKAVVVGGSGDYRWYWENDNKEYGSGIKASHRFKTVGMHVVALQYRGLERTTYDTIDTIGIAVTPSKDYKMPTVKVAVELEPTNGQPYNLSFKATATADPTTKIERYIWQFNKDTTKEGSQTSYNYPTVRDVNNSVIALTVIDGNGLKTNATIHPIMNSSGALDSSVIQDDYRTNVAPSNNVLKRVGLGVVLTILIAGGVIIIRRSMKRHKNKAATKAAALPKDPKAKP